MTTSYRTTIDTGSEIPQDALVATSLISEKNLKFIRSLSPNEAHGLDEINVRMIKFSDAVLALPLKIIFTN